GDGANRGDDGNTERHDVRWDGDQRHALHGHPGADDHELHTDERAGGHERDDQRHELHGRHDREVQRDHGGLLGDLRYGDPGDGADGGHDGNAERDDARRDGDQRHALHGHSRADDHELHADERRGGHERDAQRHELHRGHGGEVQRGECHELHGELGDGDSGDGADGGDDGHTQRDDARWHGDQRGHVHDGTGDRQLHADEWRGGHERDAQRHELHRRHGGEVQRDYSDLLGDLRYGDSGDGADGGDDGHTQRRDGRWHGDQ